MQLKIGWDQQIKVPESTQHYKDKHKTEELCNISSSSGE